MTPNKSKGNEGSAAALISVAGFITGMSLLALSIFLENLFLIGFAILFGVIITLISLVLIALAYVTSP